MRTYRFCILQLLGGVLLGLGSARADNWPCWRGPTQDGIVSEKQLPLTWSSDENVHWRIRIPGVGHSSPIVWEDAIFVTSCVLEDETRHLLKVDRQTGEIRWNRVVATSPIEKMHRDNTPASATPCTDGKLVYVTFVVHGQLWVAAYDFDGQQAWERTLGGFESAHGFSTSLILDGKRLIVSGLQDGPDACVAALEKSTGDTLWRVSRPRKIRSFSSPFLCRIADRSAIVLSGAEQTIAYDSASGATVWEVEGPAEKTVSSLVYCAETNLALVAGGRDNRFLAISLNPPRERDGKASPEIVWSANQGIPYMTSPLVSNGKLHILSDEGVYRCYDTKTGKVLNQLRAVGPVRASMVATEDRIYVTEKSGRTTVIANNEQWDVLAVNELSEEVLASVAVSDGDLVVRSTENLILIRDATLQPKHVELTSLGKLGPGPSKENSGIVKSRQWPNLFWIHNDSGDEPRVYPVRADGTNYQSSRSADQEGVYIGGAINVDWEDITVDSAGHLIVCDVGNNRNNRRDLVLYYLNEPAPDAGKTSFLKKVFFAYPEQSSFPAPKSDFNYDCEAVFTVGETVFFFTKHRSDTTTRLYRLDNPQTETTNYLQLIGEFDCQGQAVAADASPDGLRLILATYDRLWLFERRTTNDDFLARQPKVVGFKSPQVEAVCFAGDNRLFLADEQLGELFVLPLSAFDSN